MYIRQIPKIFQEIFIKWFYKSPFLAEFIYKISYEESDKVPTIGIGFKKSKFIVMLYNMEWVGKLTPLELEGVLVHEVLHVLNYTVERCKKFNLMAWNIATDMVNNHEILNEYTIGGEKLSLPKDGAFLDQIQKEGYKGAIIAEEVYTFLMDKVEELEQQMGGDGEGESEDNKDGDGNGEGKSALEKKYPTMDDHSLLKDLTDKEKELLKINIKQIVERAKKREYGNICGGLQNKITELIKPQKISLRRIIRNNILKQVYGNMFRVQSWTKHNRRNIDFLPGKKKYSNKLNIVVDTSGSCFDTPTLQLFFSEIDFISTKIRDVNIIEFDTEVQQEYKYRTGGWKKIQFKGGGGTDIQPVFDYLKKHKKEKDALLILTDGWFNWDLKNYGTNPLWVLIENDNKPTFGSSIYLKNENYS